MNIINLTKNTFLKSVLLMLKGSVISQAIIILIMPILSRFFSVDEFGLFHLWTAITSFIGSYATLKFELAIVPQKSNDEAFSVMLLSIVTSISIIGISYVAFYFLQPDHTLNNFQIFLCIIQAINIGLFAALTQFHAKLLHYKILSNSSIILSVSNVLLIGLFYYLNNNNALLLSYLISYIIGILYLLYHLKNYIFIFNDSINSLLKSFLNNKDCIFYLSPSSLISSLILYGQPIFLEAIYSIHEVGLYSMANRFIALPLILISSSLGNVFRVELSNRYHRGEDLLFYSKKLIFNLLRFLLPIFSILFIIAPSTFEIILGDEWIDSGYIVRIFSILSLIQLIYIIFSNILLVINRQKRMMFHQIIIALIFLSVYLISDLYKLSFLNMLWIYSISISISYLFLIFDIFSILMKENSHDHDTYQK